MHRRSCLGLLGFSGNYGAVTYNELIDALAFAMQNYSVIDLSTDYGVHYNLVETIKNMDLKNTRAKFIYKVGCNYEGNYEVTELIDRTIKDLQAFGRDKIECILFHRPSAAKLDSDVEFFRFLTLNYPEIQVGICTNSQQVYSIYKKNMVIKVVQVAVNPLDYQGIVSFLNTLNEDSVSVQARSILSSGLLSGKYCHNSVFIDRMRSRYHNRDLKSRYRNRIDTALEIVTYIGDEHGVSTCDVPVFLYSLFGNMSNIDLVIRGGSSLKQISDNLINISINETGVSGFMTKMEVDWSCEYV